MGWHVRDREEIGDVTELGDRIKYASSRLRGGHGGIADHLYVEKTLVTQWAWGRKIPNKDQIQAIAAVSRVNLNWLLTGEGNPIQQPEFPASWTTDPSVIPTSPETAKLGAAANDLGVVIGIANIFLSLVIAALLVIEMMKP
jgi:hypothetical protein